MEKEFIYLFKARFLALETLLPQDEFGICYNECGGIFQTVKHNEVTTKAFKRVSSFLKPSVNFEVFYLAWFKKCSKMKNP